MTTAVVSPDQAAVDGLARIWRDPVAAAERLFGFSAWSKQREIFEAIRDHDRVAVRSAHGVGKTATAARIVLLFLLSHPGARVITTAPTWTQVELLLWKEIRSAWRRVYGARIDLGGVQTSIEVQCQTTKLELREDWFAIGLSTDTPERFQGHHAKDLLLVVDEASGVDEEIFSAAQGFLTAEGAKVLLIGNPTRLSGTFYQACQPGSRWEKIHVSALDTPAFTGESVPADVMRALPSRKWVDDMAHEHGEDSPTYLVRVLGEFASLEGRPFYDHVERLKPHIVAPIAKGWLRGVPRTNGKLAFHPDAHGPISVWEPRSPSGAYLISADTAGGISEERQAAREAHEGDYCAAYVVDRRTGAHVAEFRQQTDADVFAADLARLGWAYHDAEGLPAEIFVEDNNAGLLTLSKLRDEWRYPRIYHREDLDADSRGKRTRTIGWHTDQSTRPLILAQLGAVIREQPKRLRSDALLGELRTFVWSKNGTRGEADTGAHDDLVMAAAIGCQAFAMRAVARVAEPVEAKTNLSVVELEALLAKPARHGRTLREAALTRT